MEEREKCLIAYKERYGEVSPIQWHYFKRAWDICVNHGKSHLFDSGEVNSDVLDSVIEALQYVNYLHD